MFGKHHPVRSPWNPRDPGESFSLKIFIFARIPAIAMVSVCGQEGSYQKCRQPFVDAPLLGRCSCSPSSTTVIPNFKMLSQRLSSLGCSISVWISKISKHMALTWPTGHTAPSLTPILTPAQSCCNWRPHFSWGPPSVGGGQARPAICYFAFSFQPSRP